MQGPGLIGAKRTHGGLSLIHILAFRGERIDALTSDSGSPWAPVVLAPTDLVGFEWIERRCQGPCKRMRYRIESAEPDGSSNTMPRYSDNSDSWLYSVVYTSDEDPVSGRWHNPCGNPANGPATGLFVTGRWSRDGSFISGGYTFSCTTGVITKCVRNWGYKPWKTLRSPAGADVAMLPLLQACVRAARADYCGDGVSYTRDGTLVDLFDRHGFNVREPGSGLLRESGFDIDGATWVARPRWPTGAEKHSTASETALPGCRKPRPAAFAPGLPESPTLIEVWSNPSPAGQPSAPSATITPIAGSTGSPVSLAQGPEPAGTVVETGILAVEKTLARDKLAVSLPVAYVSDRDQLSAYQAMPTISGRATLAPARSLEYAVNGIISAANRTGGVRLEVVLGAAMSLRFGSRERSIGPEISALVDPSSGALYYQIGVGLTL